MAEGFDWYGFDPATQMAPEDLWRQQFYQAAPSGFASGIMGTPGFQQAAGRGMAPAYGSYLLGDQASFADYLKNPYGLNATADTPLTDPTKGWRDIVGLSEGFGGMLSSPTGWETALQTYGLGGGALGGIFGAGTEAAPWTPVDPTQARAMAMARYAPAQDYGVWSRGIRGGLASQAIQSLQNMYEQAQMQSPTVAATGTTAGTLMGAGISPYGQGGFLDWLSRAMPTQFGIT
jgi:hypothetical protein